MILFLQILYYILNIYFYVLIAYVLLSWIPDIRETKFYYYLHQVADPYMRLFRGILVFGQMDFTPIVGFFLYMFGLQFFQAFIASL